ncbi:MAG: uroporphyrinogen-III synthase [Acidimicrobiales bacterium]
MKIVLTREAGHNGELRALTPPSAIVEEVPLTTTKYRERGDVEAQLEASAYYRAFWSLVVTSARSGDYVESAMRALRRGAAVYSVGPATTRLLVSHDIVVSAESATTALDLAPLVRRGPVLELGAAAAREDLSRALRERGLIVEHVACYETVAMELSTAQRETLALADVVFIGAPSAWSVAKDFVAPSSWVVVPGVTTGDVVREVHARVLEGWDPSLRDTLAGLEL